MNKTIIGIDPAMRANGFAICIIDNCKVSFISFDTVLEAIEFFFNPENLAYSQTIAVIENSNLQNCSFDLRGKKEVVASKARAVGKNMAVSQITYNLLLSKLGNQNVIQMSAKGKGAKWLKDEIVFSLCSKLGLIIKEKRLSQDKRDAFKLAISEYTKHI